MNSQRNNSLFFISGEANFYFRFTVTISHSLSRLGPQKGIWNCKREDARLRLAKQKHYFVTYPRHWHIKVYKCLFFYLKPELFVDKCSKLLKSVPLNIFHHKGMWFIRVHLQIRISKPLNFQQDSLGIETAQGFSELERGVCLVRINKYRSWYPSVTPTPVPGFRCLVSL